MTPVLRVLYDSQLVGHLAEGPGRPIVFQYAPTWLEKGFDLAPASIPFDERANPAERPEFAGLPGAFNDSLPDGWGLLLMDRALKAYKGLDRAQITPLDRLAYMGHRCMGALEYQPQLLPAQNGHVLDLAAIADQSDKLLHGETSGVLEELRICGGSPGGARPKVTVAFSDDMQVCLSSFGALPPGYSHWIVKFRNDGRFGDGDPVDTGRMEMAYAEMARAAGLDMPKTCLIELTVNRRREAFFAVQRFDRVGSRKIHFLSLSGYAYASHQAPSLDYATGVLPATKKLTRSDQEVEQAYRLMLFNVLAHNKDDHAKNFAYLRNPDTGTWRLAPAFDLTYNTGMANEHTTAIAGAGNPKFKDLKQVAVQRRIKNWARVLDEVRSGVARWPEFARMYGVSETRIAEIHKALSQLDRDCSPP